ncbi:MAG: hypothetical protein ABW215_01520 [Kibdelosporangium sp.]
MSAIPRPLLAGSVAAVLSGLPSTIHALATGRDLLATARAAATLIPGQRGVLAGAAAHVAVSAVWVGVLARIDRRHDLGVLGGAAAGAVIAALDLGIAARRYPAVRDLPQLPQWLDHIAFGAIVGGLL